MSIRLRRRLPLVALIIVVGALLWAVGASSPTEAQQPTADSSQLLSQLNSEGALVHRHQETGEVRFIGASKDNPIDRPAGLAENASPEEAARAHLAKFGQLFGIQNQADELRAEGSQELDGGRANTHFQQVHEGVPVLGGELNTQVDDANNLLVATGEILPEIALDTLRLSGSGIRAKLHPPSESFADFLIRRDRVNPAIVQASGIDSPGLTSSLAIGRLVSEIVTDR